MPGGATACALARCAVSKRFYNFTLRFDRFSSALVRRKNWRARLEKIGVRVRRTPSYTHASLFVAVGLSHLRLFSLLSTHATTGCIRIFCHKNKSFDPKTTHSTLAQRTLSSTTRPTKPTSHNEEPPRRTLTEGAPAGTAALRRRRRGKPCLMARCGRAWGHGRDSEKDFQG